MAYLTLAAMMAIVGCVLTLAFIIAAAYVLLRPGRMTEGRSLILLKRLSPSDLDLAFSDISFDVRDQRNGAMLKMAGWWIPNPAGDDRCAIVLHGYGDAKVGAIAWAPLLHRLGFHVLAVDLRAHGQSQGTMTTAGYFERHDLNQIIDQVREKYPRESARLTLLGVSLGAAVAAATAAMRDDLAAVVLESPYIDFPGAVTSHVEITGMMGPWVAKQVVRVAAKFAEADFAEVAPIASIEKINAPLMVISSGDDPFVPAKDQQRWAQALAARPARQITVYWHAASSFHVLAMRDQPQEYARQLGEFFAQAGLAAPANAL